MARLRGIECPIYNSIMARPEKKPDNEGRFLCTQCGERKHPIEFYKAKGQSKIGISSWCKKCTREYSNTRHTVKMLTGPLPKAKASRQAAVLVRLRELHEIDPEFLLEWLQAGNELPDDYYREYRNFTDIKIETEADLGSESLNEEEGQKIIHQLRMKRIDKLAEEYKKAWGEEPPEGWREQQLRKMAQEAGDFD